MDEILAMDDLAGLSGMGQSSISTERWQRNSSQRISNHSVLIEVLHLSHGITDHIK